MASNMAEAFREAGFGGHEVVVEVTRLGDSFGFAEVVESEVHDLGDTPQVGDRCFITPKVVGYLETQDSPSPWGKGSRILVNVVPNNDHEKAMTVPWVADYAHTRDPRSSREGDTNDIPQERVEKQLCPMGRSLKELIRIIMSQSEVDEETARELLADALRQPSVIAAIVEAVTST